MHIIKLQVKLSGWLIVLPLCAQWLIMLLQGEVLMHHASPFCGALMLLLLAVMHRFYNSENVCAVVVCITYGGLGMLLGQYIDTLLMVDIMMDSMAPHGHHDFHLNNTVPTAATTHNHASLFNLATLLMVAGCYIPCLVKKYLIAPQANLVSLMLSHLYIIPPMLIAHGLLVPHANVSPLLAYGYSLLAMIIGLIAGMGLVRMVKGAAQRRLIQN